MDPAAPAIQAPHQLGPQPNFEAMQLCINGFNAEVAKFPNIPAIAEGNAILMQLQQMQLQLQEIRHDLADLRGTMAQDRIRQNAIDHNGVARVENSRAARDNFELVAFHALNTNEPIPGFPETPSQLSTLPGNQLDPILAALGLPGGGNIGQRRKRLAQHIGLVIFL
ncbi:hypothetical protein DV735_g5067, partial [Chaetothyriales sp. CBS 134920]